MLLSDSRTIRKADQLMIEDHHYPGMLLMETAGKVATDAILKDYPEIDSFLILCGPGNNGGDGFVIARLLYLAGKQVEVIMSKSLQELLTGGDASEMLKILQTIKVPIREYHSDILTGLNLKQTVVIDALLGTGIDKKLRGSIAEMIEEMISLSPPFVAAIDLPSGLDASTGKVINPVIPASHTYTFQLPKICQYVSPASTFCGKVKVLDIGIWPSVINQLNSGYTLLDDAWANHHWQHRETLDHKGTLGHVLIVAGSKNMAGAAILATKSALAGGAGLVTVACPGSVRIPLLSACPEAMCIPLGDDHQEQVNSSHVSKCLTVLDRKTSVLIGPGLGSGIEVGQFVSELMAGIFDLDPDFPIVLDADGINGFIKYPRQVSSQLVLTPHPGEMKRLLAKVDEIEDIQSDRLSSAEVCAHLWAATTVLKGAGTIIHSREESVLVNPTGNPALATGGTGDVLAGFIASLIAQSIRPHIASGLAVYLHGKAADLWIKSNPPEALTAGKLVDILPAVFPH